MCLTRIPRVCLLNHHRRPFVSTVLLSHTWEKLTVLELRKEARARGLSTQGNKSTLIARIKEHEQTALTSSLPPTGAPRITRSASTNVAPIPQVKKPFQATAPGIPLAAQPDGSSPYTDFLAFRLPDLSRASPSPPVQIPFVPDFWNSANPKANPALELERPKLHVVSGSATHYDGGPTHNLEKLQEGDSPATIQVNYPPISREARFWPDFWESLGFPRSFSISQTLSEASKSGNGQFRARSRPLTDEEKRGLYILLGIVAGSWLAGGLVNRQTVVTEEHSNQL